MSATVDERLKALLAFSPKVIATYLDEGEDASVEYQLTFYPHLNAFKIHRSDERKQKLPVLTVSYSGFIAGEIRLNPVSSMDRGIAGLKAEWDKIPEQERAEFYDNIPLNSLYIGATAPDI